MSDACQILPVADRLLLLAVRADLPKTVAALLSEGADSNVVMSTGEGYNALMLTAWDGKLENAKILIESGADVNVKNLHGGTALLIATQKGFTEIVRLLLQHGVNPDVADADGDTPLSLAKQFGHAEIIKLLTQ